MTRAIVTDIEGTTTSVAFVHEVLFPWSRARLRDFLARNVGDALVQSALADARATALAEGESARTQPDVAALLERWIDADRKHPALKALQGMLWREGYASGELRSHVYPDVAGALRRWRAAGLTLAVFSSGSAEAQRLLFAHAEAGDLASCFTRFFDPPAIGPKREASSYVRIAAALDLPAADILFLSDTEEELDAARAAGMATMRLAREGAAGDSAHPVARNFASIAP